MPVVEPVIPESLPPVPDLIPPEPRTISQPLLEAGAKRGTRKRSSARPGPNRIRKPARSGPKVQVFEIETMKEVTKKPRVQSDEQKRRTVVVRKYGACPACRRARRQV